MIDDEQWKGQAIELSKEARADGELPFGALIVKDGKILSGGGCREAKFNTVLAHAETEAVDSACKLLGTGNLTGCQIYCTNEPCIMCAAAIFQAKIAVVTISASSSDIPRLRHRDITFDT